MQRKIHNFFRRLTPQKKRGDDGSDGDEADGSTKNSSDIEMTNLPSLQEEVTDTLTNRPNVREEEGEDDPDPDDPVILLSSPLKRRGSTLLPKDSTNTNKKPKGPKGKKSKSSDAASSNNPKPGCSKEKEVEPDTASSMVSSNKPRTFSKNWLSDPAYKNWIVQLSDETQARCSLCKTNFKAESTVIRNHALSEKHKLIIDNLNQLKANPVWKKLTESPKPTPVNEKVQRAELILTATLAECSVSFNSGQKIAAACKEAFPDSEIAKKITLGRTKQTAIVKHVIGKQHEEDLTETLRKTKFSIIVDESTDIGHIKTAAICVKYSDDALKKNVTRFWKLVQIFGSGDFDAAAEGASGDRIYNVVMNTFEKAKIPTDNIIGYSSDGASVMMGKNNSVASRILTHLPGCTILKCICHSLHLCSSEACKELPRTCEDLARDIYSYFAASNKRIAQFAQFQLLFDLDVLQMLRPSQTRWLSLKAVVDRILDQWDALKLFFNTKKESGEDHLKKVETICIALNDPFIKMYYKFLKYYLGKFTDLNRLFQSEKTVLPGLHGKMELITTELLKSYMNLPPGSYNLSNIQPDREFLFKTDYELYLGVYASEMVKSREIKTAHPDFLKDFKRRCRHFLITACKEIFKRYDFNDPLYSKLNAVSPTVALADSESSEDIRPSSLVPLIKLLPRIVRSDNLEHMQLIDTQWRRLPSAGFAASQKSSDADDFWYMVRDFKDFFDEQPYAELGQFALDILSLPTSSAACERVFSLVNRTKTKERNRMFTATCNAIFFNSAVC